MIGFLFGTLCLLALVRMAFRGGCGPRFGHRWHRRGGVSEESFARAAGEVFKRRLHITEEQEGIVEHALVDLRAALKELANEFKATRQSLVEAFTGETVDDGALSAAFARHDDAIAAARRQVVSALKQIHAVLSPSQRSKAAAWANAAGGRWV